jgi:hypothetical protein
MLASEKGHTATAQALTRATTVNNRSSVSATRAKEWFLHALSAYCKSAESRQRYYRSTQLLNLPEASTVICWVHSLLQLILVYNVGRLDGVNGGIPGRSYSYSTGVDSSGSGCQHPKRCEDCHTISHTHAVQ